MNASSFLLALRPCGRPVLTVCLRLYHDSIICKGTQGFLQNSAIKSRRRAQIETLRRPDGSTAVLPYQKLSQPFMMLGVAFFSTTSWPPPSTIEVEDTTVSLAFCCSSGMDSAPQLHMVLLTLYRVRLHAVGRGSRHTAHSYPRLPQSRASGSATQVIPLPVAGTVEPSPQYSFIYWPLIRTLLVGLSSKRASSGRASQNLRPLPEPA